MVIETGSLSVETENIFPVIKKWLYTEQDVFLRELVSNAADAITKLEQLRQEGEFPDPDPIQGRIEVVLDEAAGTIAFRDNGLGMTREEIDRYINNIAFSGAAEFVREREGAPGGGPIIGHFGLGFYSAFMPAQRVTIHSRSWRPGAAPALWDCDSSMQFSLSEGSRGPRGTEITLHLGEDRTYLDPRKVKPVLEKYFQFLPIEMLLTHRPKDTEEAPAEVINEANPLWTRDPAECTPEDYVAFYHRTFEDPDDPVLWVHLFDEELGVKGIVFLRRMSRDETHIDGHFKVFNNRVFVGENIKEVVPDFLLLQNGVIDCRDLPLNVSRSALLADPQVSAVSRYLVEQVAFRLYGTFTCERARYEKAWADLNPFVKYGCLKSKHFASFVNKAVLFEDTEGRFATLAERIAERGDHPDTAFFYVSDEVQQAYYIRLFRKAGIPALLLTHVIDQPYMRNLELKHQDVQFRRIDSDFCAVLREEGADEAALAADTQVLEGVFGEIIAEHQIRVEAVRLKSSDIPAVLALDEARRRFLDAVELYRVQEAEVPESLFTGSTLSLNVRSRLVCQLLREPSSPLSSLISRHLFDLARLSQEKLEAEDMAEFIERSNTILSTLVS